MCGGVGGEKGDKSNDESVLISDFQILAGMPLVALLKNPINTEGKENF